MKWTKAFFMLLIMAVLMPFYFDFTDGLVDSVTGIMITAPDGTYQEHLIALIGALPWLLPLGVFVGIIVMLSKKEEPKPPHGNYPRSFGGEE